jgi:hypothetical protein
MPEEIQKLRFKIGRFFNNQAARSLLQLRHQTHPLLTLILEYQVADRCLGFQTPHNPRASAPCAVLADCVPARVSASRQAIHEYMIFNNES